MHQLPTLLTAASLLALSFTNLTPTADKPCHQHPQLSGKCFNVHGKLSVYSGAPAIRIWKIGTKRILGVSDQRFAVAGYRNIPQDLQQQINQDVSIIGNYLVCPFTSSKPAEMQLICIDKAKNLEVTKRE